MIVRAEEPGEARAIHELVRHAFVGAAHSSGTEPLIVDALRAAGALTLSLVAVEDGDIRGHIAASPVVLESPVGKWFGIGPVSVRPDWQRLGIGKLLVTEALARLRAAGAAGCVVLGDPAYYSLFGFEHDPSAHYRDVPAPYFQLISFTGKRPAGSVEYHPAFDVTT